MSSTKRRILREKAHNVMKKSGHRRVNKHSYSGVEWMKTRHPSYFANHWREYV